jgi:hypothetical protein
MKVVLAPFAGVGTFLRDCSLKRNLEETGMAQNLKQKTHQPIAARLMADGAEERQLNLWYNEQAWDLKERQIKLIFALALIVSLLIFCGFFLIYSPTLGTALGAGSIIALTLKTVVSWVFKKPELRPGTDMKSRMRQWATRKITSGLSSSKGEQNPIERKFPPNTEESRR